MKRIIKSFLHPESRAYSLHGSSLDLYDRRGAAPLCEYIGQYDTYGDGTTQHAPGFCPQFSELTDVCLSFAKAIVADPHADDWRELANYVLGYWSDEDLSFCLSVKYVEGKRRFYNRGERKLSSADKSHDRRWEEINQYMDGTPAAALSILLANRDPGWITRVILADRLRDMYARQSGGYFVSWENVFNPVTELVGDWQQAQACLHQALLAVRHLDNACRLCLCVEQNSQRSTAAVAA